MIVPEITIIYPYYRNPGMLAWQYNHWQQYPVDIKDRVEIIVVDDCSPDNCAIDVPIPDGVPQIRIYKVTKKVRWNWIACRNIAALEATGSHLIMTDMDHVIPADTIRACLSMIGTREISGKIMTFGRVEPDGTPTLNTKGGLKPHPNSFFLSVELYWKIGGYDERLSGLYGTDSLFRERAYKAAEHIHRGDIDLIRYSREIIHDASTNDFQRKEGRVPGEIAARIKEREEQGQTGVLTLSFPYEQVR